MTPSEMMSDARALLNDQSNTIFTDTVLLAYYNMSIQKLQEVFELNSIPVTHDTSAVLNVPANTSEIAFEGTVPTLPSDLIDIIQLWESPEGQDTWTPLTKKSFLPHYLEGQQISQFLIFSWAGQKIKLLPANADNDLKIDYVRFLFQRITIDETVNPVTYINVSGFLTYWMAGLAAWFIGENQERATTLYGLAEESLLRSLGISIKGQQSIATRRRPFRASYKRSSVY